MEKKAWSILLAAHYKWEKNHGDSIRDQMNWYFFDLYKEETDQIIAKETGRRLFEEYGPNGLDVMGVSEEMYVSLGLLNHQDWLKDVSEEDYLKFKEDLVKEYQEFMEDFKWDKLNIEDEVRDELTKVYSRLFNAPENLIVEYNGEIIQQYKDPYGG